VSKGVHSEKTLTAKGRDVLERFLEGKWPSLIRGRKKKEGDKEWVHQEDGVGPGGGVRQKGKHGEDTCITPECVKKTTRNIKAKGGRGARREVR